VYKLAPRTPRQWALWALAIACASIAEEAFYRGVGMSILWYSLGNPWISALLCAAAFAVAHSVQGLRSTVFIGLIALVKHALVAITGTLLLAMLVHAVYDLIAGWLIAREAETMGSHAQAAT
jgi:membrane protease YdiL (CAAX protease family)